MKELYNQNSLLHSRNIAGSSFHSLSKIPHCCPETKVGPYLNPNVADHSFKSAKDHRLGSLLNHQLPNLTKAHPLTILIFMYYKVFFKLNYSLLKGR